VRPIAPRPSQHEPSSGKQTPAQAVASTFGGGASRRAGGRQPRSADRGRGGLLGRRDSRVCSGRVGDRSPCVHPTPHGHGFIVVTSLHLGSEPLATNARCRHAAAVLVGWRTHWRTATRIPANRHIRNGLENRYPSLGGSRVRIPPPPLDEAVPGADLCLPPAPDGPHTAALSPLKSTGIHRGVRVQVLTGE
jgi:hypothetical protein